MRRFTIGFLSMGFLVGCNDVSDVVTGTNFSTGTYTATLFRITPDGQPTIDVLLANGSLTITFDREGTTAGSLVLPAGVPGGPATVGMTGTATIGGLTVQFNQSGDSFVREATWSRIETSLQLIDVRVGSAVYNVALVRQ